MAIFLVMFPAILSSLVSLSETISLPPPQIDAQTSCGNQPNNGFICELQEMKLKIIRLEAILEENISDLNAKSLYVEDRVKLIDEMGQKIHDLRSTLLNIKDDSSRAEERLNALEEEVRLLWAASRKNNFDIHILESKAQDSDDRLDVVRSQVQKMADIVTEHWIQIRHLEQALQGAEMRAANAQRLASTRCTLLKFVDNFENQLQKVIGTLESYLFRKGSSTSSYESQSLRQLKNIFSAAKKYHHQLQGFISDEMEKNKFTAAFANKEVVFLVASALITFPLLSAWMLLSSQFC